MNERRIINTNNTGGLTSYDPERVYYSDKPYMENTYKAVNLGTSYDPGRDTYKTPQWKIGTQVTYWDDSSRCYSLGLVMSASFINNMWIYIINNTKVLEKDIKELIEVDNQALIKDL